MKHSKGELDRVIRLRTLRITDVWMEKTGINLSGLVILAEAATGIYAAIPAMLLKAGASHVYAWSRDSAYGIAQKGIDEAKRYIIDAGQPSNRVTFEANTRPKEQVSLANIIMNNGHVRPIDKNLLEGARHREATVALMYDAWEARQNDVDLTVCRELGIGVAGVDESDESLGIFKSCGHLAVKMALNAGYEIVFNRIMVWSTDQFGDVIADAFRNFGAYEVIQTTDSSILADEMGSLDFIFLCE